jgi:hypothetical protein
LHFFLAGLDFLAKSADIINNYSPLGAAMHERGSLLRIAPLSALETAREGFFYAANSR